MLHPSVDEANGQGSEVAERGAILHSSIAIIGAILSIGIGFVVAQTDSTLRHPATTRVNAIEHFVKTTPEAQAVFSKSCADCHSNQTHWPWYAYAPYWGARIQGDVRKARNRLNLSDWPALMQEGPEEVVGRVIAVCDEVELNNMPPSRYTLLHSQAKLTQQDRKALCSWSRNAEHELRQRGDMNHEKAPNP